MTKPVTSATPDVNPHPSRDASAVDGDRIAVDRDFSDVVENYADFAYNVAYRMLRNVEDAEDAVQEAFISAYHAFSSFKGQSKVSTWLHRIVVNSCLTKMLSHCAP